jgi:hypothetical protein
MPVNICWRNTWRNTAIRFSLPTSQNDVKMDDVNPREETRKVGLLATEEANDANSENNQNSTFSKSMAAVGRTFVGDVSIFYKIYP